MRFCVGIEALLTVLTNPGSTGEQVLAILGRPYFVGVLAKDVTKFVGYRLLEQDPVHRAEHQDQFGATAAERGK
jgi:hypothetical protein